MKVKYSGSARLFWYRLIYLDDQLDSKFDQLRSQSSCRKWCDWNIFSKHIETMVKCAICWDRIIHHPRQQKHTGSSPWNEEIRLKKQRKVQILISCLYDSSEESSRMWPDGGETAHTMNSCGSCMWMCRWNMFTPPFLTRPMANV